MGMAEVHYTASFELRDIAPARMGVFDAARTHQDADLARQRNARADPAGLRPGWGHLSPRPPVRLRRAASAERRAGPAASGNTSPAGLAGHGPGADRRGAAAHFGCQSDPLTNIPA